MVRDIESSNERVKRKVNNVIEEFFVVYAKIGPEPVTLQVQASGIPSPRYEWFYRPNDDPNNPGEDFIWTPLSATQGRVLASENKFLLLSFERKTQISFLAQQIYIYINWGILLAFKFSFVK